MLNREELEKARRDLIEVLQSDVHDEDCSLNRGGLCSCTKWWLKAVIYDLSREGLLK